MADSKAYLPCSFFAFGGEDADLHTLDGILHGLQFAGDEHDQITGHGRRGLEMDFLQPAAEGFLALDRHVGDRRVFLGHDDGWLETGAEHRFIPAGKHAAGVGWLHLRGEEQLLGVLDGVAHVIETLRLVADVAGEIDRDLVFSGRQRLGKRERDGLLLGIHDGMQGDEFWREQAALVISRLRALSTISRAGRRDLDVHFHLAGGGEFLEVGLEKNGVMPGHDVPWAICPGWIQT